MDYSNTRHVIAKGKLLPSEDMQFITNHISEIQDNWKKRQVFRTETEMRISVLNDIKFPTPAAKYWQCVREQSVFYEQLVQLSFDYRRNQLDQEELELDIKNKSKANKNSIEVRRLKIDLEEKQFQQLNMEQVAQDRVREIRLWSQLMQECIEQADFDTENVNTHQLLSYTKRFENQMQNIGNASPSELQNLVGQYNTAVRHVKEAGLAIENRQDNRPLLSADFNNEVRIGVK